MENSLEEAFYEVSEILKELPKDIIDKIPQKFIQIVNQNKSKTYNKKINGLDEINELKIETIVILGLIYRDFLCDKETRKLLLIEEQKDAEEKYNYNDLFKKDNQDIIDSIKKETTALIKIKEDNWYNKIINFFKRLFKQK